jgi:predicted esterase
VAIVALVAGGALWSLQGRLAAERAQAERIRWAHEEALPEIRALSERGEFDAAVALAEEAERYIPTDPELLALWGSISMDSEITTVPSGAEVSYRPYAGEAEWRRLGTTPLVDLRLPRGVHRWRIEKAGYETIEWVEWAPRFQVALPAAGSTPKDMVPVPGNDRVGPFFIDRFEVTNRAFQDFVGGGGYADRRHWRHPFVERGRTLVFEEAMGRFRDTTGQPGPAGWRLSSHPQGEADHPVHGLSWYEAAAYCEWQNKSLPTLEHWMRAALVDLAAFVSHAVVPASNFTREGPAPVGRYKGIGPYGTYDMAGNVKEWGWNESGTGRRISLGGGWSEPTYMFKNVDEAAPMDRRAELGFRCMRVDGEIPEAVTGPLPKRFDPRHQKTMSDEAFAIKSRSDEYAPLPLDAEVDRREDHPDWTRERVTFAALYNDERVIAHLFLPKTAAPPFQAVVYWPGDGAMSLRSFEQLDEFTNLGPADFVRGGRAVVYPIYKGTYERGRDGQDPSTLGSFQGQDFLRTLEYLETRSDIDARRLAYLGVSWGASLGAYVVSGQRRHGDPERYPFKERHPFKAMVLISGGLHALPLPPENLQASFAPRVRIPVLMINGRYDAIFDLETQAKPLFALFGAPPKDKRLVVADGGHWGFPLSLILRETTDWLDRYLGPVVKMPPGGGSPNGKP